MEVWAANGFGYDVRTRQAGAETALHQTTFFGAGTGARIESILFQFDFSESVLIV
jgi:hypothetical protein